MRRNTMLVVLTVMLTGLTYSIAFGQCRSADSILAQDDSYLPIQNSNFDPCDSWLRWDVWFERNAAGGNNTRITFEIHGHSDVYEVYNSDNFNEGDYHFSDTKYIGQSSSERLYMGRSGDSTVKFSNIKGKAAFFAGQEN